MLWKLWGSEPPYPRPLVAPLCAILKGMERWKSFLSLYYKQQQEQKLLNTSALQNKCVTKKLLQKASFATLKNLNLALILLRLHQ